MRNMWEDIPRIRQCEQLEPLEEAAWYVSDVQMQEAGEGNTKSRKAYLQKAKPSISLITLLQRQLAAFDISMAGCINRCRILDPLANAIEELSQASEQGGLEGT